MTVAIAAPSMPQSSCRMKNRSRTIFSATESARNQRGVTESPTARSIAEKFFAPHNRKNDEHEPQYVDGAAVLIPEVKPAVDAFLEAGFLNAARSFDAGGMQLPTLLSQACFAHFQSANIATSSYSMLTMGVANLIEAFGNDEQKRKYLQPIIDGRFFGTMALTEPHAGSSLSDIDRKSVV